MSGVVGVNESMGGGCRLVKVLIARVPKADLTQPF